MLKIIEERKKQQTLRLKIAKQYVDKILLHCGKTTAIVYGSTARGDFKDHSDIDVVIVSENLPSNPMQRLDFLFDLSDGFVEPKGYTIEEFKHICNTPFGKLLRQEGIIITDNLMLFKP